MNLDTDRVRKHTAAEVLRRIDTETEQRLIEHAATPDSIAARLRQLDREWDIDRAIEAEASIVGLAGLTLGAMVKRQFLALPLVIGSAVFLYAFTGRYPMLPLFRRFGLRTASEIAGERYALKALRGDFAEMGKTGSDPVRSASAPSAPDSASRLGLVGSESRP